MRQVVEGGKAFPAWHSQPGIPSLACTVQGLPWMRSRQWVLS